MCYQLCTHYRIHSLQSPKSPHKKVHKKVHQCILPGYVENAAAK